jgi:hypothetical protein
MEIEKALKERIKVLEVERDAFFLTSFNDTQKLAASQAREKVLRAALESASADANCYYHQDVVARIDSALSTPSDDTALRQWGAKLLQEMAENVTIWIKELDPDERYYVREMLQRKAKELEDGK